MVFLADHPTSDAGKLKGIKQVLLKWGLWKQGLHLECKRPKQCSVDLIDCCARRLLSQQPVFLEQKSSVQEVIEATGHLHIFLLNFHCELNFIEFFWGAVKKYLQEHYDYTFDMLRAIFLIWKLFLNPIFKHPTAESIHNLILYLPQF